MAFISLLSSVIIFLSFYGRMSTVYLLVLSFSTAALMLILSRRYDHSHDNLTMIDQCAVTSNLHPVNAGIKVVFFGFILVAAVAVNSIPFDIAVLIVMTVITIGFGGIHAHTYISLLLTPAAFILVSGLALLLDYSAQPMGVLQVPFLGGYLVVTGSAQLSATLILCKALAAVSCLYSLSLSTPLYEIISVLRKVKVPELMIELMFLIYRYIFILSRVLSAMKTAAAARFGFSGYSPAMRTAGGMMTNLLILSFQKAGASYDAMESRCYDGHLNFLSTPKPIKTIHLLCAGGCILFLSAVYIAGRSIL